MNQLRFLRLALLLPALITVGCGEAGNDEGDKQIELPDKTEETQQAFADEETTGGFTFTAKQSWTATVTEGKATRAGNVDWLRLLYEGEEKYSGAAGTFTLVIELDENYSGKTRTATITISAGTSKITVTVTQDGKTEDGEIPEQEPNGSGGIGIPPAGSRLISKITVSGDNTGSIDFTYDSDNRLIGIEAETTDNEGVYSNITLSYNSYTLCNFLHSKKMTRYSSSCLFFMVGMRDMPQSRRPSLGAALSASLAIYDSCW